MRFLGFFLETPNWITLHLSIVVHVYSQMLSLTDMTIVKDFTWTFSINIYSWGDNGSNPWKEFFFFLILAWNLVSPDSSPLPWSHNKRNWNERKFPVSPVLMDISFSFGTKVGYLFQKRGEKKIGLLPAPKSFPSSLSVPTCHVPSSSEVFCWSVPQAWETHSASQSLHEVLDCSSLHVLGTELLEGQ